MTSELAIKYSPWGVPPMFKVLHQSAKRLETKTFFKAKIVYGYGHPEELKTKPVKGRRSSL